MKYTWITLFFLLCLLFVGSIIGVNFLVDPLQQYKKTSLLKPVFLNERYLNAGLAKSHEYDSIILGTSMSENFLLDDVSSVLGFKAPIKLTISGASVHDINKVLETAYEYKKVKNVLCDIHFYSYTGDVGSFSKGVGSLPDYLYDDKVLNDYKYLMNIDTVNLSFRTLRFNLYDKKNIVLDKNRMYQWQHIFQNNFGVKSLLRGWENRAKDFDIKSVKASKSLENLKANFNLDILPMIEKHPETNFYLYYPPYSILKFKQFTNRGWFNNALLFKEYVFETVKKYPNVKIYDFQIAKEITHDLNNYKDISHYYQDISHLILEYIREDKYKVTSSNVNEINQILVDDISTYEPPNI